MLNSQVKQTQDHPVSENNLLPPVPPKLTRSQQAVLDLLKNVPKAIAAQDVFMMLRQTRSIGLATVYRSLEVLKVQGLVKCAIGQQGEALYSLIGRDIHCMTCLHCHQSMPLDRCPLSALEQNLQSTQPFRIYYHTLEFFGICPTCQNTEAIL
jgi:Fur family transcriptional regulator, ferric uptake regulator